MRIFRAASCVGACLIAIAGCQVDDGYYGAAPARPPVASRPDPERSASPTVDDAAAPSCARPSEYPGERLYSASDVGAGVCGGTTLASAIEAVHALLPELQDVSTVYDPRGGVLDGSYVYAFLRRDGGFDLAFKRGTGDCESGCMDNTYWYFSSGAECTMS